jgi:hypothetical protein
MGCISSSRLPPAVLYRIALTLAAFALAASAGAAPLPGERFANGSTVSESAPDLAADWPQFRFSPEHTGFNPMSRHSVRRMSPVSY